MGKTNYAKYDPRTDSSEGAQDYWADPQAEEGSEEAAGFYPGETVILLADAGQCPCGCGEKPTGEGRTFKMGHDARLKGILIRAHITGKEVAQVGGGGIVSGPALTVAQNLGWSRYLEAAAEREANRKANKANRVKAPKAATGPKVGDQVADLKIGRWTYDATITAVWDDGVVEFEYTTKKGERQVVSFKDGKQVK